MTGTAWNSADLLARFNDLSGRGAYTADVVTPTTKYRYLADAQAYIVDRIAAINAKVLFGSPQQMSTADGGLTWTFGTDGNGYPLFPIGPAKVYPNLSAIPGAAWLPGIDYLDEGTQIRMVNNTPYTGTLYWYGVTPPAQMSDSVQPVLFPPPIRMLIVRKAVAEWAQTGNLRNASLADRQTVLFEKEFGEAMTLLRKHFAMGGGLGRMLYPWGVGAYGPGWGGAWWA